MLTTHRFPMLSRSFQNVAFVCPLNAQDTLRYPTAWHPTVKVMTTIGLGKLVVRGRGLVGWKNFEANLSVLGWIGIIS